jgi:hypothetical protein
MLQKDRKTTRRKVAPKRAAAATTPPPAAVVAATVRNVSDAPAPRPVSAEERARMIAEAAYFRAQRRGFRNGDTVRDWAEAEAEIDAMLLHSR